LVETAEGGEVNRSQRYLLDTNIVIAVLEQDPTVLPSDEETTRFYAQIKDALRRKGRPIPENDIWFAAVALQHNLVLAPRVRHFEHIEGLLLERW
jgi:tRNA(fMet)-specific endonuclease VapC